MSLQSEALAARIKASTRPTPCFEHALAAAAIAAVAVAAAAAKQRLSLRDVVSVEGKVVILRSPATPLAATLTGGKLVLVSA